MDHLSRVVLRLISAVAVVVLVPYCISNPASLAGAQSNPDAGPILAKKIRSSYGKLPISFEANQGQTDSSVQFLARGMGYTVFLTPGEAVLSLHSRSKSIRPPARPSATLIQRGGSVLESSSVRMLLIGSNTAAEASGVDQLPGKSNYFIGSDPSRWRRNVPTFAKVRYRNIYPGVDLVYYGNQEGRLEHDFVVAPGVDPHVIAMKFDSANRAVLSPGGDLIVQTQAGNLTMQSPTVYQDIEGRRKVITASYDLADDHQIRFRLGPYDKSAPLVIDPVLTHSAVFGGNDNDLVEALAIDNHGNAYVAGATFSLNFPTVNPVQSSWIATDQSSSAGFVAKINAAGTALIYSTYLGGPDTEADGIAVDSSGRVYIGGLTGSGFPLKNASQPTFGGGLTDAFYTILSASGSSLVFSTYIGGSQYDYATALARDPSGNVYLTGRTDGKFPALHTLEPSGTPGVWVAKFNSSNKLQYSIMYGNVSGQSTDIAVDASGSAYIVGYTHADDIPITPGAFRSTCGLSQCGWAAKLSPSGTSLVYSTYLGLGENGGPTAIALDPSNDAYIAGAASSGLPFSATAFQKNFGGGDYDGFVEKLSSTGHSMLAATYLGGRSDEVIYGLALDLYRNAYVSGWTCSSNYPLQASIRSFSVTSDRPCQFFVTTLNYSLSSIPYYSTLLGGPTTSNQEIKIKVDSALNVYLTGFDSGNVNPTSGSLNDVSGQSGFNVFVSKLDIEDDLTLSLSASPSPVSPGQNLTYTITITSKGPDFGTNVLVTDSVPSGATFVSVNAPGAPCRAPVVGGLGVINCILPRLNKGATWVVKMTVKINPNLPSGTIITDSAATKSNMQDFNINNGIGTVTTVVH